MKQVDREIDRYLALLRAKIRDQGLTQRDIQQALGWGRSYISQILNRQKGLRLEQLLLMLNVIGVDPVAFFDELYDLGAPPEASPAPRAHSAQGDGTERLRRKMRGLEELLEALVKLLLEKRLITSEDLRASELEAASSTG